MSKEPHTFDLRDLPPDKTRRLRFGPKGVAIWIIVGILGLGLSGFFYYHGVTQHNWVPAKAEAVDGWIWVRGRYSHYYVLGLKYEFHVGGAAYTGECEWKPSFGTGSEADDALEHIKRDGQTFTVYYNPENPTQSVKDKTEATDLAVWFLGGSVLFIVIAIWMYFAEKRYWGNSWGR